MAKKKPISRKELLKKPDEFYTISSRLFRFVLEHKKQFIGGLAALVAVVIVISGIRYFSQRAENRVFSMLDQSFSKYQTLAQQKDSVSAFHEVEAEFRQILKQDSRKEGGKISRIIYANLCYEAGEYEKAVSLYQQALEDFKNRPFIQALILSGLGYSHQAQKDHEKAIGFFDRIVAIPGAPLKDEALFNLGRLYAELGQAEKSRSAFEKIISDHPDSLYIEMVKEKISS